MSYEFKKLSDVDVVAEPAESANVLIEENGVIKKAPKTTVGGDNNICFVINYNTETIICNKQFDEILDLLFSGFPCFNCFYISNDSDNYFWTSSLKSVKPLDGSENLVTVQSNVEQLVLTDDDWNYFTYFKNGEISWLSGGLS